MSTQPEAPKHQSRYTVDDVLDIVSGVETEYNKINQTVSKHDEVLKNVEKLNLPKVLKECGKRLYQLENLNIDLKVSEAIDEQVKEAVRMAMVGPFRSHFKNLSTIEMKEMLQDRMFQENQHTGHEAHIRLYEALEASILQDNADLHHKEMESQRKKKKNNLVTQSLHQATLISHHHHLRLQDHLDPHVLLSNLLPRFQSLQLHQPHHLHNRAPLISQRNRLHPSKPDMFPMMPGLPSTMEQCQ